jgi:hypothetical protein
MQCACAALYSVACPVLQYLSTLSHKSDFWRSYWKNNMCFDFLYNVCWNISHSKNNWARYDQDGIGLRVMFPLIVSYLYKTWILSRFPKNTQISTFTEIHLLGAKLFQEDVRTDITKLIVEFRNFANAPKQDTDIALLYLITTPHRRLLLLWTWRRTQRSPRLLGIWTKRKAHRRLPYHGWAMLSNQIERPEIGRNENKDGADGKFK